MTSGPQVIEGAGRRRLSAWLLFGIILLPGLFCWFLLRRGYSNQLRSGGFAYAAVTLVFGLSRLAEPYG